MKKLFLLFILLVLATFGWSQSEILSDTILNKSEISAGRKQLHLMIEREQKKADVSDGVYDKMIDYNEDISKTGIISNAIFSKTNKTVAYIENNEKDDLIKRKYLGRVIDNLKLFNTDFNDGYIDIPYYAQLFDQTYYVIKGIHNKNLAAYVKKM